MLRLWGRLRFTGLWPRGFEADSCHVIHVGGSMGMFAAAWSLSASVGWIHRKLSISPPSTFGGGRGFGWGGGDWGWGRSYVEGEGIRGAAAADSKHS